MNHVEKFFFLKVSITAMEESRVLVWHRDKLKLSIIGDQFLLTVFDHILGRDVVKKLIQVRYYFFKNYFPARRFNFVEINVL